MSNFNVTLAPQPRQPRTTEALLGDALYAVPVDQTRDCVLAGVYDETGVSGDVSRVRVVTPKVRPRAVVAWSGKQAAVSTSFVAGVAESMFGFGGGDRLVNDTDQQFVQATCCIRRIGNVDDSGHGFNSNFVTGGNSSAADLSPSAIHLRRWICHGWEQEIGAGGSSGLENAYILLGGKTMQVRAGLFYTPTGTPTSQAISGLGFEPQAVLFIGAAAPDVGINGSDGHRQGMGAASSPDADEQFAMATFGGYLSAPPERFSRFATGVCVLGINESVTRIEASLQSMDADGFTLDYAICDEERAVGFIAFRWEQEGGIKVGHSTQPAATGAQAITGVGFEPEVVMGFSTCDANTGIQGHANWAVGGGDLSLTRSAFTGCPNAAALNPNPAQSRWNDSWLALCTASAAPSVDGEANLYTLDADGFTLDWLTTDGVARKYGWIAMKGWVDCPCSGALPILHVG